VIAILELADFCGIGLLIALLAGSSTYALFRPRDEARLRRLERKLDLILRHLNIAEPEPAAAAGLSEEVKRLADAGDKIGAIKLYREQTGLGLKDAKDAVDAYLNR
jgi:hypothetical protein